MPRMHGRVATLGTIALAFLLGAPGAGQAAGQDATETGAPTDTLEARPVNLDGPRIGITYLTPGAVNQVNDSGIRERFRRSPFFAQFGWQWERRFFTTPEGGTGVTEFILLVGGMERNLVLPSLTWVVGFRGPGGSEFGMGPNLSLAGGAWVFAGGTTFQSGGVNFPVNIGIATSPAGARITFLAGFNVPSER